MSISNNSNSIPFLDLVTPHVEMEQELTAVFHQALHTAGFIGGPMVEEFEKAFAAFCGTTYSIAISSGTDALRFAIMACGVRPGDVVVTVPHTFIATTEAISQAGALPEFVDIDERTYNMDPEKLREYLEEQCKKDKSGKLISRRSGRPVTAVVPVHLYGQTADMDAILELADRYALIVIEDACQAHGAEYFSRKQNRWMKAGSMGRAAAFSFYPGKNLGACGEAGAVTTNDAGIAKKISMLRDHGQAKKYYHDIEGYNGRLDALQAGLLHAKLAHLPKWNAQRRERASEYNRLFAAADDVIIPPFEPVVVPSRVSPVRDPHRRPGRDDEPPEESGNRDRNSLPDSLAPAEGLCIAALSPRRFSRGRKSCRGNRLLTNVPAADRRAASQGGGGGS